ncbi:Hypothetical predicted protein [Lecanosticta acicola]|uniref:Uncharacterized protein n=1 Tax=Lecanosticta acicola TaxID=111012 RepID=A0AAI9EE07_9PEZI|nr:Hypothetical predicted protein [Lecanosticta acicola]
MSSPDVRVRNHTLPLRKGSEDPYRSEKSAPHVGPGKGAVSSQPSSVIRGRSSPSVGGRTLTPPPTKGTNEPHRPGTPAPGIDPSKSSVSAQPSTHVGNETLSSQRKRKPRAEPEAPVLPLSWDENESSLAPPQELVGHEPNDLVTSSNPVHPSGTSPSLPAKAAAPNTSLSEEIPNQRKGTHSQVANSGGSAIPSFLGQKASSSSSSSNSVLKDSSAANDALSPSPNVPRILTGPSPSLTPSLTSSTPRASSRKYLSKGEGSATGHDKPTKTVCLNTGVANTAVSGSFALTSTTMQLGKQQDKLEDPPNRTNSTLHSSELSHQTASFPQNTAPDLQARNTSTGAYSTDDFDRAPTSSVLPPGGWGGWKPSNPCSSTSTIRDLSHESTIPPVSLKDSRPPAPPPQPQQLQPTLPHSPPKSNEQSTLSNKTPEEVRLHHRTPSSAPAPPAIKVTQPTPKLHSSLSFATGTNLLGSGGFEQGDYLPSAATTSPRASVPSTRLPQKQGASQGSSLQPLLPPTNSDAATLPPSRSFDVPSSYIKGSAIEEDEGEAPTAGGALDGTQFQTKQMEIPSAIHSQEASLSYALVPSYPQKQLFKDDKTEDWNDLPADMMQPSRSLSLSANRRSPRLYATQSRLGPPPRPEPKIPATNTRDESSKAAAISPSPLQPKSILKQTSYSQTASTNDPALAAFLNGGYAGKAISYLQPSHRRRSVFDRPLDLPSSLYQPPAPHRTTRSDDKVERSVLRPRPRSVSDSSTHRPSAASLFSGETCGSCGLKRLSNFHTIWSLHPATGQPICTRCSVRAPRARIVVGMLHSALEITGLIWRHPYYTICSLLLVYLLLSPWIVTLLHLTGVIVHDFFCNTSATDQKEHTTAVAIVTLVSTSISMLKTRNLPAFSDILTESHAVVCDIDLKECLLHEEPREWDFYTGMLARRGQSSGGEEEEDQQQQRGYMKSWEPVCPVPSTPNLAQCKGRDVHLLGPVQGERELTQWLGNVRDKSLDIRVAFYDLREYVTTYVTNADTELEKLEMILHSPPSPLVNHAQSLYESDIVSTWAFHTATTNSTLTSWAVHLTKPAWTFYKTLLRPHILALPPIQADLYTAQLAQLYDSLRNTSAFQEHEQRLTQADKNCIDSLKFGDAKRGQSLQLPRGISAWKDRVVRPLCEKAGKCVQNNGVLEVFRLAVNEMIRGFDREKKKAKGRS